MWKSSQIKEDCEFWDPSAWGAPRSGGLHKSATQQDEWVRNQKCNQAKKNRRACSLLQRPVEIMWGGAGMAETNTQLTIYSLDLAVETTRWSSFILTLSEPDPLI